MEPLRTAPTDLKFSILIPTLNEEKYISRLLESLVKQTYQNFEVIVVDAHSEDKTVSVIKTYQKRLNIKVIISKKRNISYQRNLAVSGSHSDHLIFFDADVTIEPSFISTVKESLNTSGFSIATSWLNPISNRVIDKLMFGLFNLIYLETAKYFIPGGTASFLYVSKEAFRSVHGFDITTNYGEDFDFIKRVHSQGFNYHLFRKPKINFSVRRLDKEGRLFYFYKMLRSGIYYHTHGTIRDPKIFIKNEFGKF